MGRQPQNDRHMILLREFSRRFIKMINFRRISGLENRRVGHAGVMPIVLLILRGVRARVVSQYNYHATDDID